MSATVSVEDRGFTLGDGVFDTALALDGVMIARERHLTRLLDAASAIGIAVERAQIETAIDAALGAGPSVIRTTVTRGSAARGLWPASPGTPTVVVTAAPWNPAMIGQPARLITSSLPRNERSPTARYKTLNYLDNVLAAREAAERGADDALLLNTVGRVACTTIANIFALKDRRLLTPPVTEGCLPGIVRGVLLEIAREADLAVEERPLLPAELRDADALFATNSLRLIRPVTTLDRDAPGDAASQHLRQLIRMLAARMAIPDSFIDAQT